MGRCYVSLNTEDLVLQDLKVELMKEAEGIPSLGNTPSSHSMNTIDETNEISAGSPNAMPNRTRDHCIKQWTAPSGARWIRRLASSAESHTYDIYMMLFVVLGFMLFRRFQLHSKSN